MELREKVVVVTGAGSGIGAELCRRFVAEGAATVVAVDRDAAGVERTVAETGALGRTCDVTDEAGIAVLIDELWATTGGIDLWCSNAGIARFGGVDAPLDDWNASWAVNVLAHRHAVVALLPKYLERGGGGFLHTVSAAGMLSELASASYTATKHAALGFAEWVSIHYGERGITVAALCPQQVVTPMLEQGLAQMGASGDVAATFPGALTPAQVAATVVEGLADGRFLIVPHPEVITYEQRRAADRDRWLAGMRRLVRSPA